MLELRARDGVVFDPFDADVSITPKGSAKAYTMEDLLVIGFIDATLGVVEGNFGPPGRSGMPIRGLRFTDTSDFSVEIPMPVPFAQELGRELARSKIEVVSGMPTGLLLRQAKIEQRRPKR